MKKILSMILTMMLLLTIFSGCGANKSETGAQKKQESEMLRICMDVGYLGEDPEFRNAFKSSTLITNMLYAGKTANVDVPRAFELEYIPSEGTERETALTHIRTEVMSGGGPDLFITVCSTKYPLQEDENVFVIPEKAMELAIFLPLDEYMENDTHFAEWDRMNQTVLNAGRNEEGQQIIPMCYTIPAAVYRAADVEHTPSKETTWADMLESDDIALKAATVWTDGTGFYREGMPFLSHRMPMTECILGALADYREEELLFTAKELEQRLQETVDLCERYTAGEFDAAPAHYVEYLGMEFDQDATILDIDGKEFKVRNGIERTEDYTLIPLYSDDGGVTAEINAYMAINRNSKCPEDAYRVLDYLMSLSEQRVQHKTGSLYTAFWQSVGTDTPCIPMYDELMCEETRPLSMLGDRTGWYLLDENYTELCEVREQITNVKFRNALDKEFTQLFYDYYQDILSGGDGKKVAEEGYRKIQRILRE